jgi:hypothetical protein
MEIKADITQIPTTHRYARKHCAVRFSTCKCAQHNLPYKVFTECINLWDFGETFSNKTLKFVFCLKNSTDQIPNLVYYKVYGKFRKRNVHTNRLKNDNSIRKPLKFIKNFLHPTYWGIYCLYF